MVSLFSGHFRVRLRPLSFVQDTWSVCGHRLFVTSLTWPDLGRSSDSGQWSKYKEIITGMIDHVNYYVDWPVVTIWPWCTGQLRTMTAFVLTPAFKITAFLLINRNLFEIIFGARVFLFDSLPHRKAEIGQVTQ